MSSNLVDKASEILRLTHDGKDLLPSQLKLVQLALEGSGLDEQGRLALGQLYESATQPRSILRVEMPAHALETLMDAYRNRDPKLLTLLEEFQVLAIHPWDEHDLAVWENEGGK
jgi:hypothetical protein